MRDPYEVLQVRPGAEPEVVRAAYRVLARKYHPDLGGDATRMVALNDAWDVLGDPVRRAAYDASRAEESSREAPTARNWPSGPAPSTTAPAPTPTGPTQTPFGTAQAPFGTAHTPDANRSGPPPGHPSGTVLDFGRYAGWSLGEIARYDLDYLEWLQRATFGRRLRAEIETLVRQRRGSGPASSQGLPRR
jgi:curved DNA-binding protein CbpA